MSKKQRKSQPAAASSLKEARDHFGLGLGSRYVFNSDLGIHEPLGAPRFSYNDGDAAENRIFEIIRNSKDISVGSSELLDQVFDWPSLYHLTPARVNLLRPLKDNLAGKSVLELGSGCGAISRYLAEIGCDLTCVEGSRRRAAITASRCRDMPNVTVVNDNFQSFDSTKKFDVVTLIGVLEYSRVFIKAENPILAALALASSLLKPDGVLLVAIENQLGLKYLAGAPEDHLGQSYFGVHGLYNESSAVTFGKDELCRLIIESQFDQVDFLYPFPDYKLPTVILTGDPGCPAEIDIHQNLLASSFARNQARDYSRAFSEQATYPAIVNNGLMSDLANSFLAIGIKGRPKWGRNEQAVGYAYSDGRPKSACKEVSIWRNEDGYCVRRKLLHASTPPAWCNFPSEEVLSPGLTLFSRLIPIVNKPGWNSQAIVAWFRPLIDALLSVSDRSGALSLPGEYLDGTPFNFIIAPTSAKFFDLELNIWPQLALEHVVFRGLLHSFSRLGSVSRPASGVPLEIPALAALITSQLLGGQTSAEQYLDKEAELQRIVTGRNATRESFRSTLQVRHSPDELLGQLRVKDNEILRLQKEVSQLMQRLTVSKGTTDSVANVAIVLHLFYPDLWTDFAEVLQTIPFDYDFYVTTVHEHLASVQSLVLAVCPRAKIIACENRGRDIGPLVTLLGLFPLESYDLVLKLHTKKSLHLLSNEGQKWRRDLLQCLLPDGRVGRVLEYINDHPNVGIFGSDQYFIDAQSTIGVNRESVSQLSRVLGFDTWQGNYRFFAGSMFWIRGVVLGQLKKLSLNALDFDPEEGQTDGTLAHAVERIFPLLATCSGYEVEPLRLDLENAEYVALVKNFRNDSLKSLAIAPASGVVPAKLGCIVVSANGNRGDDIKRTHRSVELLRRPLDSFVCIECWKNLQVQGIPDLGWTLLLSAGDTVEPFLVEYFSTKISAQLNDKLLFAYSDHDEVGRYGTFCNPAFKPDYNPELLLSFPYTGRSVFVRNDFLKQRVSEWSGGGSLELGYWLALAAFESGPDAVLHFPQVLLHLNPADPIQLAASTEVWQKLATYLEFYSRRTMPGAKVLEGPAPGTFHVVPPLERTPLVSIVIPTRDQVGFLSRCVDSLLTKTDYPAFEILVMDNESSDPDAVTFLAGIEGLGSDQIRVLRAPGVFNFSRMNNLAVAQARGELILMLNNDTAVLQADWLKHMVRQVLRPGVGIVGARLLYPDGKLQHAGVILGLRGPADHPCIGLDAGKPGYMFRAQLTQNFSAVTAACLLVSKETYQSIGGLDEATFGVSYNDVDFCLRVGQTGARIVWTPLATLLHEGSASQRASVENLSTEKKFLRFSREQSAMFQRWPKLIAADPAYNINLSLVERGYEVEINPLLCHDPMRDVGEHRVVAFAADEFGCGHYRVIQPMQAMRAQGLCSGGMSPELFGPHLALRSGADTLVFQRPTRDCDQDLLESLLVLKRVRKVFEVDDDLSRVPIRSAHHAHMPKDMRARMLRSISLCDRLVVSTEPLAHTLRSANDDVRVVPNRLPPVMWGLTPPDRVQRLQAPRKPVVGWAGGVGHAGDLALIAQLVRDTADQIDWVFFGMCPDSIRPYVKAYHEGVPTMVYPARLMEITRDWDLAVAPLEVNPFNECKSNLRLLEYGWCGVPVLCSDVVPYQCDLPVTRVKNRYKDWRNALSALLAEPGSLRAQGLALQQRVAQEWVLDVNHARAWYAAWTHF